MPFYLTSHITINDTLVKANKVTWKSDVNTFIDSCSIHLPRLIYLKNDETSKTKNYTKDNYQFKEGDKVIVSLGYNKKNVKRFEGFIKGIKMDTKVELECEGYGSILYDIMFNKSYRSVTVKKLVTDLAEGTDITISDQIPDIPLSNVRLKNLTGIQVLEWLKKECSLCVYFNFNELYVGTMFGKVESRVKARIGFNVAKDSDLKQRKVDKNVKIVIKDKDNSGEVNKVKSSQKDSSNEKFVKVKAGIPAKFLKEIADRLQTKENYKGYEGSITLFLEPFVKKGMVLELDGGVYPDKTGDYFIEAVDGEFGESGGRQKVTLGFLMKK